MHICMTYFEPGIGVLVPNPGYPTYSSAVTLSGAVPLYYDLTEENSYQPDCKQLTELVKKAGESSLRAVKALFLNYPHMPTCQLPDVKKWEEIVSWAKQYNILLIHDNPYSFILNSNPMSLLSITGAKEVVIELNSLSKSQNMAGWRVGILCAAKERVDEILRFKSNMDSGMFLPVQLAAAKALSLGKEWYDGVNKVYAARREKVCKLLDVLQCRYSKKQAGMFVWAKIPAGYKDGFALSDKILYESNVFITPGGIFGSNGNGYVRVSLCSTEEKLEEAIQRIVNK
jgi:LL-diaminopimelate aminotransferase